MSDFMKEHFSFLRDFFEVKPQRPEAIHRKVKNVEKLPDGREIWTLECGHQIVVTQHRILRLPCSECFEERKS